jgi:flagellar biosynthesis/type III secretory pathway protein FliH
MEARVFRLTEKLQKKEAEHEKNMSEVLKAAASNYKKLEDEHFKNINTMKEAEERAWTEETKPTKVEAEIAEIQEKMKKLESECLLSIGKAHKEGMEKGLVKGKELGKEGAMEEVKAQFQMVYNSGLRHGWKSALR